MTPWHAYAAAVRLHQAAPAAETADATVAAYTRWVDAFAPEERERLVAELEARLRAEATV